MVKPIVIAALLAAAAPVAAQETAPPTRGDACTPGTSYVTIRHNRIKPGKWRMFEEAIAAHNAWYVVQGIKTETKLARVIAPSGPGFLLTTDEAVTITRYEDDAARPPSDAAREAFIAKYNESSVMTDEMRVCIPAM